jgi:CBS domain-containing protein
VFGVGPDESLNRFGALLRPHRAPPALVLEHDRIVGIVSVTDLLGLIAEKQ